MDCLEKDNIIIERKKIDVVIKKNLSNPFDKIDEKIEKTKIKTSTLINMFRLKFGLEELKSLKK